MIYGKADMDFSHTRFKSTKMPFTRISLIRAQRVYAKGCFVPIRAFSCLFVPNRLLRHRNECAYVRPKELTRGAALA